MEGMIFAAGIGSRLKPFTDYHPKALAPVGRNGLTALDITLIAMIKAGVRHVVVNVHHFAEQITEHLRSMTLPGIEVNISDESDLLLDTGGGLVKAAHLFSGRENILVHNVDIIEDLDLRQMEADLESRPESLGALLATDRRTSRYFLFDCEACLRGWENIDKGIYRGEGIDAQSASSLIALAFGGIHVIRPEMLSLLKEYEPEGTPFSITDFYIDTCRDHTYTAWSGTGEPFRWHDIGTPEKLELTTLDFPEY